MGRSWSHLGVDFIDFLLENVVFRENRGFRKNIVSRRVLDRSWLDLGGQKASSWEAFGGQVEVRKAKKSDAKKSLVLTWSGGGDEGARGYVTLSRD